MTTERLHTQIQASAPTHDRTPEGHESVQRRYPAAPLVGVAAAVFDRAGRVLLVQRGRSPDVGKWGLPGGLLELGEKLADGACREVREECGIEIEIGGIAGAFEPIQVDDEGRVEYHYVVVDFWATHARGEIAPADDALAVTWTAMEELESYKLRPDTLRIILDAYHAWSEQTGSQGGSTTPKPEPQRDPAPSKPGSHP